MKDFLKKNKIAVTLIAYVVLILAFMYFLVMPSIVAISDKAQRIQQQEIDRKLNEERAASLPSMEEGYVRFKDNEGKLVIIMDSSKEVDFIEELEVLAEETENRIEFRVQESVDKKAVSKKKEGEADIKSKLAYTNYLSMQIALEGDYDSLLKFMNKVENLHNYVNIVSVSSEKNEIKEAKQNSGPFSVSNPTKENGREVLNTILDVVVYMSLKK